MFMPSQTSQPQQGFRPVVPGRPFAPWQSKIAGTTQGKSFSQVMGKIFRPYPVSGVFLTLKNCKTF